MRTIDVLANPWIALDKDGIPQGVVGIPGSPSSYIGAQVDLDASNAAGRMRFFFPLGKTDGKCRVPFHHDIVTAVQAGELIVCSKEDAAICGITAEFKEPKDALADERAKALAYYQAARGPDAKVQDIPRAPKSADPAATAAPAAPTKSEAAIRVSPFVTLNKNTEA